MFERMQFAFARPLDCFSIIGGNVIALIREKDDERILAARLATSTFDLAHINPVNCNRYREIIEIIRQSNP